MKFLTQMKSCDVVTVTQGKVQAIKGPVAYIGYEPALLNQSFAVDAKMFVAAVRKFKYGFNVVHTDDKVILYDEEQEVDFIVQPAEIPLSMEKQKWEMLPDFSKAWNIAYKFIRSDFPGIKISNGYLEVLSDHSIVRIVTDIKDFSGIFASVKLPAGIKIVSLHNNRLWFGASNTDFIVINSLDVTYPNTDQYFNNWPEDFIDIPQILRDRFVETDKTVFTVGGVQFVQEEKATAIVENVHGVGSYAGGLFNNVMAHGNRYSFQDRYLAFEANNIRGIVARVD